MIKVARIVLFLFFLTFNDGRYAEWEEIKPYCAVRPNPQCCISRDDDCFMPYYDSRCYCDVFCFRGIDNHDCCPDHDAVCLGANITKPTPAPPPPRYRDETCHDSSTGREHQVGETFMRDCNLCRCVTLGNQASLSCEEDLCVNNPDLLNYVSGQQPYLGWTGTAYEKFQGVKVKDALKQYLGTIPDRSLRSMVDNAPDDPVEYYRMDEVDEFDARTYSKFSGKIRGIRDQGKCGISWALSTVDVAADRLSLVRNLAWDNEPLSVQNILSCTSREAKDNCEGGRVAYAWGFIKDRGVVTEDCYPYESGSTSNIGVCKFQLTENDLLNIGQHRKLTNINCPSGARGQHYNFGPAYRVRNEARSIKYEIHFRGPVQATMRVTPDFFLYRSGIYRCSGSSYDRQNPRYASLSAYHSIRLLGWGTAIDPNTNQQESYWIAANSWGTGWGANGYFYIRFGECEIEETIIATYGKSTEVLRRKNKRQS